MRGDQNPTPIIVQSAGLIANVPPHVAPQNTLTAGNNVYLDIDGYLKPRPGYTPFLSPATTPEGTRLHGGIGYQDQNLNLQYVVASNDRWFADISGTWTDISDPADLNNGADTDPERFHVFYQGGVAWVIGVDNFSSPKWWNASLSTYETLNTATEAITTIVGSGTVATVTLTNPTTNIVTGDSVTIAGNATPAFNVTATVTGVPDSTHFTFASTTSSAGSLGGTVTDNTTMLAPAARDIQVMANRVILVNTTENGTRFPRRIRWSAVNDATRWPQLAFLDALDYNDQIVGIQIIGANLAIVYGSYSFTLLYAVAGSDASAFAVQDVTNVQGYVGPISPAAIVPAEGIQYYLGVDARIYTYDGVNVTPISATVDPVYLSNFDLANGSKCHGAYLAGQRQVWFFTPTMTLTSVVGDPSVAEVVDIRSSSILPPMTFREGITASFATTNSTGVTWETIPGTWISDPYTWDNIPLQFSQNIMIGTTLGEVDVFFTGNVDGQTAYPIPYSWTFALYSAPNVLQQLKLSRTDLYFKPIQTNEFLAAQFDYLGYPDDPGTPLMSIAVNPSEGWVAMPTEPGPDNPANQPCNFLQLKIFSIASLGTVAFAGGVLYFYSDMKGDLGKQ